MKNNNEILSILLDIKQDVGEVKAAVKHLDNTLEAHTESDDNMQGQVVERLDTYNTQLEEHMRRTELLEKIVEKINSDTAPLLSLSLWVTLTLKVAAAIGVVITIIKFVQG